MKYLYEFIGTFFLMLTVGMTVVAPQDAGLFAPLAIGSVLAVLIYAGGHISGAHYNPAVSLAVFLRGRLNLPDLFKYWIAQFVAACLAALLTLYLKGAGGQVMNLKIPALLIGEILFTFALCFVVLNVATTQKTAGNSYFGLAIGFTVLAGAYAVGPISGAAFNPAVALGISILKLSLWKNLWIYVVANLVGGALAAYIYKLAHPQK